MKAHKIADNKLWRVTKAMFPNLFSFNSYEGIYHYIFEGIPSFFNRYNDQGIVTIGSTHTPAHGILVFRGTPVGHHMQIR